MSRSRNIKPGFFKNEILAELAMEHRLLFIGLWTEADREGRLEFRPRKLKAELFPYDDVNIEDGVSGLVEGGFLHVYDVDGTVYIQIINWGKHQNPHHKEVGSVIPSPPGHVDTVCKGYIHLSNTIRRRIYSRDGRVCRSCGATHGLSIDHIVPVSRGGNSTDDNLQVLCLGCNVQKGASLGGVIMHDSSMIHGQVMDEPCGSHLDPLIPDSPLLIPDSLKQEHVQPAAAQSRFGEFWSAYPNKKGRQEAEKAWKRRKLDSRCDELIAHVRLMDSTDSGWKRGFIPMGSTYLNQGRWEDVPQREARAGPVLTGVSPTASPPSKTLSAIQTLQGMKHGNRVDPQRDSGRFEPVALLEPGSDTGGGHDRWNGDGVVSGGY